MGANLDEDYDPELDRALKIQCLAGLVWTLLFMWAITIFPNMTAR